ncbi:ATP dependent DNA ligase-like protein [Planoprotostelium fungivorum]|uniref:ATP dependent DNA ligase-like protein n=1 Tax=Planoprotostelium fungivorum TaxID=1890364 RepID=A0A2P6NC06_9EUKA|nr:ATP dependent DNA ligase-like protein [Planoprotostelium fungivorum]
MGIDNNMPFIRHKQSRDEISLDTEVILGRGIGVLEKVSDKICSRKQARVFTAQDGCANNPIQIIPKEGQETTLSRDSKVSFDRRLSSDRLQINLHKGDVFILPGGQEFSVEVEDKKRPHDSSTESSNKKSKPTDLKDGDSAHHMNHRLERHGDVYQCDCEAWKYTPGDWKKKTCKHLISYLGQDHETKGEETSASEKEGKPGKKKDKKPRPPIILAEKWTLETDPTGYWISEKLDGVRAYWDGQDLISRLGNKFCPPDFFREELPLDMKLDGELWIERRCFQATVSVVRTGGGTKHWAKLKYKVFDAPSLPGTFEDRMEAIRQYLQTRQCRYVTLHEQEKCEGHEHLKTLLNAVEVMGGEGLMLREAGSHYEPQRSRTLLKVKNFYDAEAKVLAHEPGKGKFSGMCGALWCDIGDGTKFSVGSGMNTKDRKNPPAIGSIITFRYQELSDAGIPRFPVYVGERHDVKVDTMNGTWTLTCFKWPPSPDRIPKPKTTTKQNAYTKKQK